MLTRLRKKRIRDGGEVHSKVQPSMAGIVIGPPAPTPGIAVDGITRGAGRPGPGTVEGPRLMHGSELVWWWWVVPRLSWDLGAEWLALPSGKTWRMLHKDPCNPSLPNTTLN